MEAGSVFRDEEDYRIAQSVDFCGHVKIAMNPWSDRRTQIPRFFLKLAGAQRSSETPQIAQIPAST
jgi:hypothetical protein